MTAMTLPQPVPPTLAAIVSELDEGPALRIVDRLTAKDAAGRYTHTAERVAAELSLAGYRLSASSIRTWRRLIDFNESVNA